MLTVINFIQRAILQGTPLLYGATGEILTEKSGNLNLGIPGIMYIGAIVSITKNISIISGICELFPFFSFLFLISVLPPSITFLFF